MEWNELKIHIASADLETAEAVATMTVPYGFYSEDYSDMDEMLPKVGREDYVDADLLAMDRTKAVIHIYLPENTDPGELRYYINDLLDNTGIEYSTEVCFIGEDNWSENWKKYYKPEKIGERLVICPSWEKYDAAPGEVVMMLDPGAAFGSGKHETTSLSLCLIESHLKPGMKVLDIGCGSGVLSVAADLLGAEYALGVDIDPNAVKVALENAGNNGLEENNYFALTGDITEDPAFEALVSDGYDMLCANIVADVIMSMQDIFYKKLVPGGRLIVSGIIDRRADEVSSSLEQAGFIVQEKRELNGWAAFLLRKPQVEE